MNEALIAKARCPKRHWNFNKINFQGPEWAVKADIIEKGFDEGGFMCAILGKRGTGKTQMGVELIRYALSLAKSCIYRKMCEIFMAIKQGYNSKMSEEDVLLPFRRAELLILDEIQERSQSDWENQLITYLIDRRYDDMKSTVLIGNVEVKDAKDSLGASIYSRLIETGGVIECDWKSFRK